MEFKKLKDFVEDMIHNENITLIDKIKTISNHIGLNPDTPKTVVKMHSVDADTKHIVLKRGSWETKKEPWFVIDEDATIDVVLPVESMIRIIDNLRVISQENFNLKLEKAIWQHIPSDFDDVWAVSMDKIKDIAQDSPQTLALNIDAEKIVKEIKEQYPNLFINMNEMIEHSMEIR